MNNNLKSIMIPNGRTKYLFFGGKGGVGKTTMATSIAIWFADHNYKTTIVSTDPTVSLSTVFNQEINGDVKVDVKLIPNLSGLNINPKDAIGIFQKRISSFQNLFDTTGINEMSVSPCMEEMATFDQFVSSLEDNESDVVVFDTAPSGKTLREIAKPFNWASYIQMQINEGQKLTEILSPDIISNDNLEKDKKRYDHAIEVLADSKLTVFSIVLLPERLPIEESQSAVNGLSKLGISVQNLIVNQCIMDDVIDGNDFLLARANLQKNYIKEIETRFSDTIKIKLPLLKQDAADILALRKIGKLILGD